MSRLHFFPEKFEEISDAAAGFLFGWIRARM